MRPIVLALFVAACTRHPTVPDDMLIHVPPEAISRIAPLETRAEQLEREIVATSLRVEDARVREATQAERLEAAQAGLEADQRLKELAVERGDPTGAQAADASGAAGETLVRRASAELQAATAERERLEAELALLEADRDLVAAQIERERALGVASQVEGFDLNRFDRAVRDASERRDEAARRLTQLGGAPAG